MRADIGRMVRRLQGCLLALALLWTPAHAQLPVPELTAQVIDTTGTLQGDALHALQGKLAAFEKAHGTQIVVLMVPSTAPEDIAAYANRVASTWKIGRRDTGDGLLLVVAKDDRRLRMEVARALEGAVTDLAAKNIIDTAITPRFRQGDFAGGLDAGLDALFHQILREELPAPTQPTGTPQLLDWSDVGVLTFFAFAVVAMFLSGEIGPRLALPLGVLGALPSGAAYVWGWKASATHSAGQSAYFLSLAATVILLIAWVRYRHRHDPVRLASWAGVSSAAGTYSTPGGHDHGRAGDGNFGSNTGFRSGGGGSFGGGGASGSW